MIINLVSDGWQVLYHRAHALLAAQIAGYWQLDEDASYLVQTIAAISHHDDLEKEWQDNSLTEAGAPKDFQLDQSLSVEQLREHIDEAHYRSRWVAMLTSMHTCFLNQSRREESDELAEFLDQQVKLQATWQDGLGISQAEADRAYQFMRWCDRISLILCQQTLPTGERWLEITEGPDGARYNIRQRSDGTIAVKPWPFSTACFTVHSDATHLSQLQFKSQDELVKALKAAPTQTVTWAFSTDE
ncbi:MAG: DUF3891 family protein [Leptolyngbya sp. SIO4C1]|nr:DUF3891 family protein [Leptolyngbya sp. SIO4C1]